jgi:hypothetical protein
MRHHPAPLASGMQAMPVDDRELRLSTLGYLLRYAPLPRTDRSDPRL